MVKFSVYLNRHVFVMVSISDKIKLYLLDPHPGGAAKCISEKIKVYLFDPRLGGAGMCEYFGKIKVYFLGPHH